MAFCVYCGGPTTTEGEFCPHCGRAQATAKEVLQRSAAPQTQSQQATDMPALRGGLILAVCCGIVTAVGAVLPWATSSSSVGNGSASGLKLTEGVLVLVIGIVAALAAVAAAFLPPYRNLLAASAAIAFVIAGGIAGYQAYDIHRQADAANATFANLGVSAGVEVGYGLFVAIAAAAIGAIAAGAELLSSAPMQAASGSRATFEPPDSASFTPRPQGQRRKPPGPLG